MTLEHRAEDQRADDVLVAADDREERVQLRTPHRAGVRRVGAAREDVERRREAELDDRVPELVVHRVVVVGDAGIAGQHHAAHPLRLDRLEVGDGVVGGAHRGLPEANEPVGCVRAELGDPLVVRVEARLLVVPVRVVAQDHADRRVDDLGGHAVAVLVVEPRLGIPAAAVQVLEPFVDVEADLLGRPPGCRDEPERHERVPVVDEHHVAQDVVMLEARRAVAVRGIDVVEVARRRLGDVRVGRDARSGRGRSGHDVSSVIATVIAFMSK